MTTSQALDSLLADIADYVLNARIDSDEARSTARLCLMDSLGCAILALGYPECTKLLGPVVEGAVLPGGARVPGTRFELDPFQAAFNIGCMIRWLDYNDTWLAAEWGHPSDNLGGILACADWRSRRQAANGEKPLHIRDLLTAMIKAHEIQGVLALENAFNRVGLDHVLLVRVATTAVATGLLGGDREQIQNAVSNAWLDGGALRTYRHAPNTGSRKSWAAGDATSRGVRLALWSLTGEMGYATPLSAPKWGFCDALFAGKAIRLPRPLASYVMENVLFKISYPVEFHAQTAVEAAVRLHHQVPGRLEEIQSIRIETQESAVRIIDKTGPLHNPADRDHCLQYATAIGLLHGGLTANHYEDTAAADPRIDALRAKMQVVENPDYSRDYLDPDKRSVANAVQVVWKDGSVSEHIEVEYPIGHRRRREEGAPLLNWKFQANIASQFSAKQCEDMAILFDEADALEAMPVHSFVDRWIPH